MITLQLEDQEVKEILIEKITDNDGLRNLQKELYRTLLTNLFDCSVDWDNEAEEYVLKNKNDNPDNYNKYIVSFNELNKRFIERVNVMTCNLIEKEAEKQINNYLDENLDRLFSAKLEQIMKEKMGEFINKVEINLK